MWTVAGPGTVGAGGAAARLLTTDEARELAGSLRRGARRELLDVRGGAGESPSAPPWAPDLRAADVRAAEPPAADPRASRSPSDPRDDGPVPSDSRDAGPAHRVLLDRSVARDPRVEPAVRALCEHAAVRVAAGLTASLLVVDREHVLVWPLGGGAPGAGAPVPDAAYLRAPGVATAARELFQLLWSGATEPPAARRPPELTAAQWRILRLMTTVRNDTELAAAAGVTVKTVRSHLTAVLRVLDVPTRFAAGVEAARRGWL